MKCLYCLKPIEGLFETSEQLLSNTLKGKEPTYSYHPECDPGDPDTYPPPHRRPPALDELERKLTPHEPDPLFLLILAYERLDRPPPMLFPETPPALIKNHNTISLGVNCEDCNRSVPGKRKLCFHCGLYVCPDCWEQLHQCEPSHSRENCRALQAYHHFGKAFIRRLRARRLDKLPHSRVKPPSDPPT